VSRRGAESKAGEVCTEGDSLAIRHALPNERSTDLGICVAVRNDERG
jgi:hypothetical protein